jgi:hypothetical protein
MPAILDVSVNAALTAMAPAITRVIYHRGDATGDISHVLAAMANDAALGVIVMDGHGTNPGGWARVANVMVDHFRMPNTRVKFVATPNVVPKPPKAGQNRVVNGRHFTMYPLTKSTNFIIDNLAQIAVNPLVFKNMKSAVRGPTLHRADITGDGGAAEVGVIDMNFLDPQCAAFLIEKHIDFTRSTVVLWGRESGRNPGGQHPNHDHGYTGMKQIIDECTARAPSYQVIVAGDFRPANSHGVATQTRQDIAAGSIVLGKFWDNVPLFQDRFNQVRLFYVLKKMLKVYGCNLVHVGMRSGGLDMYAFSGQKTIYVSRANGDARMAPVVAAYAGAGLGTTFQKHTAARLPKRGPSGGAKPGRPLATRGYAPVDDAVGPGEGLDTFMDQIDAALA